MERAIPVTEGEILLYGHRFPVYGAVTRRVVTPFPPKVTIGDYSRADKVVESEWVLSDWTGGLGIFQALRDQHLDRYWYGTLDGRWRALMLPPVVTRAGTLAGPADLMVEFNEVLYVAVGANLYRWDETSKTFVSVKTLSNVPEASAVYNGALYIVTQNGFHKFDGSTWTDYTTGYVPSGYALIEFEGKLWRLGLDNVIYWATVPDNTQSNWTAAGQLPVPPGYCRQFLIYFDQTNDPAIHAVTKVGVYGYDHVDAHFEPTPLTFPVAISGGKGAMVWRGELYVPAGPSVYKFNGATVQVVGPDKDDGLPSEFRGDVKQLVPGHGYWFAIVDAPQGITGASDSALDTPWPHNTAYFPTSVSNGLVLVSPEQAFHVVSERRGVSAMGAAVVTSIPHRLWFSDSEGIYYVTLPRGLHNPFMVPDWAFEPAGELITSWNDMGWAELRKLALSVNALTRNVNLSGGRIQLWVGWDESPEWYEVGTITGDGEHTFLLGGIEGRPFKSARFKIRIERGDNPSFSPQLRSLVLTYLRTPEPLFGWEVQLHLVDPYCRERVGVPARDLVRVLEQIVHERRAGEFVYRNEGVLVKRRVWLSELAAAELTGEMEGRYTLSIIELDSGSEA